MKKRPPEPVKMPAAGSPDSGSFKYRVLIADEDVAALTTMAQLLSREGYELVQARDGFEALACLRFAQPNILVSELAMPNMSGFELLAVVRKRFPGMGVIAISGQFAPTIVPDGVLADRFVRKGTNFDFELLETVRDLISEGPLRSQPAGADTAPAWLPRSATGYVVVTCPKCIRSSSIPRRQVAQGVLLKDTCIHCDEDILYRIDTSVVTTEPPLSGKERSQQLRAASRHIIDESKKRIENSKALRWKG